MALYTFVMEPAGAAVAVEFDVSSSDCSLRGSYRCTSSGSSGLDMKAVLEAQISIVERKKIPTAASRFLPLQTFIFHQRDSPIY